MELGKSLWIGKKEGKIKCWQMAGMAICYSLQVCAREKRSNQLYIP